MVVAVVAAVALAVTVAVPAAVVVVVVVVVVVCDKMRLDWIRFLISNGLNRYWIRLD